MEEQIIIVDSNDQPIGSKPRSQVAVTDIYRVSALAVYDQKGRILLGKRSATKKNNPNLWAPLVNGTNAVGETYQSNIIKEAKEEIGLVLETVKFVNKLRISETYNFFVSFFKTIIHDESELVIDPSEIQQLRWFTKAQLFVELKNDPSSFVPGFLKNIFPSL